MAGMFAISKLLYLGIILFCAGDFLNALFFNKTYRVNAAMRFALAYGLGAGGVTLLLFYLSCAGVPLTFGNAVVWTAPLLPLWLYYSFVKHPASVIFRAGRAPAGRLSCGINAFCIVCITSALAIVFFRALFLPIHLPDDMVQWCIRAKIIFHNASVFADEFFEPCRLLYHAHYPVMIPLLESLVFMALGEADDVLVKIPFPFFFLALLAFFYATQRRFASRSHALLFTAMLAVMPVFIQDGRGNPASGYADVPLSFYYFIAVVSLLSWLEFRLRSDLFLAVLAISLAIFTKKEGSVLWLMLTGFAAFFTLLKDRKLSWDCVLLVTSFGLLPALLNLPWTYIKTYLLPISAWEQDFGLSLLSVDFVAEKIHRLPALLTSLWRTMFLLKDYNVVWFLFFFSIIVAWRKAVMIPRVLLPVLILTNIASVLAASFLYPHFWWGNFAGDMPRLLMFNTPLLVYFISQQTHAVKIIRFMDKGPNAACETFDKAHDLS